MPASQPALNWIFENFTTLILTYLLHGRKVRYNEDYKNLDVCILYNIYEWSNEVPYSLEI